MKSKHIVALFTLGSAVVAPLCSAAIVIQDTFAITETRVIGSPLVGSTTEIGNKTWNSASDTQWYLADGGYVTSTGNTNRGAAVPFTFGSYSEFGTVATVEVDVRLPNTTDTARYFTFGFGNHYQGNSPTNNGFVYVRINMANKQWALRNRDTTLVSGYFDDSFAFNTINNYSISYDASTLTVTDISINGVSVLSNYVFASSPGSITHAFYFSQWPGNPGSTRLDSFTVSMNPASVPEPAAAAYILGLSGLFTVAGRRARWSASRHNR